MGVMAALIAIGTRKISSKVMDFSLLKLIIINSVFVLFFSIEILLKRGHGSV